MQRQEGRFLSQETRLLWLYNELLDHAGDERRELKPAHATVMLVLLARDYLREAPITKAELGAIVGLKERQVHSILKDLEGGIQNYLLKKRQGGKGRGRAANIYEIRGDATGGQVQPDWPSYQQSSTGKQLQVASNAQSSAGNAVPSASPDRQSVARENTPKPSKELPVACGEILPPIEHAPARGNTNLKLRDTSQLYPERAELAATAAREPIRLNGKARGMAAHALAAVIFDEVNSPFLDPNRSQSLSTSAGVIHSLMDAGADFDLDILPTIKRIMANKREHIRSLGYFEDAIRQHAAARMAAEAPRLPITPAEANTHDHTSSTSVDGIRVRREPVSPATAARLQRRARREAERQPIDYGRVDSQRVD